MLQPSDNAQPSHPRSIHNPTFRLRGREMTRIETFTDAAFAFALTFLVVSLNPPTRFDELVDALRLAPAFAIAFAVLMPFWYAHHAWSRRYGLDDVPTVLLSCLLVFIVLVYVYPLRFLSVSLICWVCAMAGWELPVDDFVITPNQLRGMFVMYGLGFAAMSAAIALLFAHAWRRRAALDLDAVERFDTLADVAAWSIVGSAGLASAAVAMLTEPSLFGWPGWVYMILPVVMPIFAVQTHKRRRRLLDAAA